MSILFYINHCYINQICGGVLDIHNHCYLNTGNITLHPAFNSFVLHIWLGLGSHDAIPKDIHDHRIIDISLTHSLTGVIGKDHVC